MKPEITYILKSINADLTSYNNFQWKESGIVTCPDWSPKPKCGNGLHGFLMGEGSGELANWKEDAKWLVLEVDKASIVDLIGKVKFPSCEVVFCGDRKGATDFIISKGGKNVIGSFVISGDKGTSTSGYRGTSNSGNYGTSTSGDYGTSTSGNLGTSNSGDQGTSNSGDKGTSTSRYNGTSTSGDKGTSTSGNLGTSTSGDYGTSTSGVFGISNSGYKGTSTSGDYGTSTSGDYGTSTSGDKGILIIKYWNIEKERFMVATAYVGENGIEPNIPYKLDENHQFVEVFKK